MNNKLFENIPPLDGIDELKTTLRKWQVLSERTINTSLTQPIPMPGMLWVSEPGIKMADILNQITDFFQQNSNNIKFNSRCRYVEIAYNYNPPENDNLELRRFIEKMRHAARFKYEYKGIVYIDISKWIGHEDEEHFKTFLEYLSDHSNNWLLILSVVSRDLINTESLECNIATHLMMRKISLKIPNTTHLVKYIENKLKQRNLMLTRGAKPVITQSVGMLRDSKAFNGFEMLDKLCDDITCEMHMTGTATTSITKDIAERFSINSEYIKRANNKKDKNRTIGFAGGQNER